MHPCGDRFLFEKGCVRYLITTDFISRNLKETTDFEQKCFKQFSCEVLYKPNDLLFNRSIRKLIKAAARLQSSFSAPSVILRDVELCWTLKTFHLRILKRKILLKSLNLSEKLLLVLQRYECAYLELIVLLQVELAAR